MDKIRQEVGYEPGVWPPKGYDPLLSEIGRIVFNWNICEQRLTNTLNTLLGGEHKAIIATAHMGNRTKTDALQTIAKEYLEGAELASILHAIKLFERLLSRRNHYVHSFSNVSGGFFGTPPIAKLGQYQARGGRLSRKEQNVTAEMLASEAKLLHEANHYFALLHNHFRYPDNPDYLELPEEFPLPDVLNLPLRFVLGDQPPHQS